LALNGVHKNRKQTRTMQNQNEKKVVLLGDGGVGKTSWVSKIVTDDWEEVHPFDLDEVSYNIWDVAGQEKYGLGYEKVMEKVDVVFIFYDSTSKVSYQNTLDWKKKVPEGVPIRFVRTKCDLENKNEGKIGIPVSTKINNPLAPFFGLFKLTNKH
jgi:small GTP-binding protein